MSKLIKIKLPKPASAFSVFLSAYRNEVTYQRLDRSKYLEQASQS